MGIFSKKKKKDLLDNITDDVNSTRVLLNTLEKKYDEIAASLIRAGEEGLKQGDVTQYCYTKSSIFENLQKKLNKHIEKLDELIDSETERAKRA